MQARFAVLLLLAAAAGAAAQPANPPTVKAAIDRRRDLSTYAEKLALVRSRRAWLSHAFK